MLARSGSVLAVVMGGIALGAVLGVAANPRMKTAPEQPWHGALEAPAAADAGYQLAGTPAPSPYRESYAPSWADEALVDRQPDYPAWTYSDLSGDYAGYPDSALDQQPTALPADEQALAPQPETTEPPETSPQPSEPDLAPEPHVAGNLAALY